MRGLQPKPELSMGQALIPDGDMSLDEFECAEGAGFLYCRGERITNPGGASAFHPGCPNQVTDPRGLVELPVAPAFNCGIGLGHKFQIGGAFQRTFGGYKKAFLADIGPGGPSPGMNRDKLFDQAHRSPMGYQVGGRCGQGGREGIRCRWHFLSNYLTSVTLPLLKVTVFITQRLRQ